MSDGLRAGVPPGYQLWSTKLGSQHRVSASIGWGEGGNVTYVRSPMACEFP